MAASSVREKRMTGISVISSVCVTMSGAARNISSNIMSKLMYVGKRTVMAWRLAYVAMAWRRSDGILKRNDQPTLPMCGA